MTFDQSQNEGGHAEALPGGGWPVLEGRLPGTSGALAQPGAPPDGAKKRAAGELGRWALSRKGLRRQHPMQRGNPASQSRRSGWNAFSREPGVGTLQVTQP